MEQKIVDRIKTFLSGLSLSELKAAYIFFEEDRLGRACVIDTIEAKAPELYARHFDAENFDLDVAGLLAEI